MSGRRAAPETGVLFERMYAVVKKICLVFCCVGIARAEAFTHFEARQTHAIAVTPDGRHLLALNSIEGRLSVFDVSNPANVEPVLVAEIPVGLEPVAVAARSNDEAWVVNEVSDSISIVSLSRRVVVATLAASDEPSDVVFAGDHAFVSCARNKLLRVFDASTRAERAPIPLQGIEPRALAVDPSGAHVYAAFLLSGNRTTILPFASAPEQPAPANPSLPPPPKTALIVTAEDSRVSHVVLDRDVAEIDAASLSVVRYLSGAGTTLTDLAVHPQTGDIWVANMEARNLVRFEPVLRGHVVDHRLTRLNPQTGSPSVIDLNPGIDYTVLPNPAAQAAALAEPRGMVFSGDGRFVWVAAFASDRLACLDAATGEIVARLSLRPDHEDSSRMRGPRSLVWSSDRQRLYVLNKISNTIAVVQASTAALLAEVDVASHNPMPAAIRQGRGFLYDARLSGNGTISCSSCHLDADRDGLAWDLGNPGGELVVTSGTDLGFPGVRERIMHPMKGPMVTQTLRGMEGNSPFHWRGDASDIENFNPAFPNLLAGPQLSAGDMGALKTYLLSLKLHPNPNLRRDGGLPETLDGHSVAAGRAIFESSKGNCFECHGGDRGTNNNIDSRFEVGSTQPVKNVSISTVYQRLDFDPRQGAESLSGFGLIHDGTGFRLPTAHPYVLDSITTQEELLQVSAYVKCFSTGTPPAVGATFTVSRGNNAFMVSEISDMETLALQSSIDFTVHGTLAGRPRAFFYNASSGSYVPDSAGDAPLSRGQLLEMLEDGDVLNFLGAPSGEGERYAGDRNDDGNLDGDEPPPALAVDFYDEKARLEWSRSAKDWTLEDSPALAPGTWKAVTEPRSISGSLFFLEEPIEPARGKKFFRLRRTW